MSKCDSMQEDMVQMYTSHVKLPDGSERVRYAYGEPWVCQALMMDDIGFETKQEAIDWWERRYGS